MPPSTPEPAATVNHLSAIIGGLVTVLLSLIAYITNGFKKTQENQQEQLDEGVVEFTNLKLTVAHLQDDNKALRDWCIELEADLDAAREKLDKAHETIIKIQVHHLKNHKEPIL